MKHWGAVVEKRGSLFLSSLFLSLLFHFPYSARTEAVGTLLYLAASWPDGHLQRGSQWIVGKLGAVQQKLTIVTTGSQVGACVQTYLPSRVKVWQLLHQSRIAFESVSKICLTETG